MVRADPGSTFVTDGGASVSDDFRTLVGMLPVAVYICEAPSGVITYFNEQAVKLWGRRPRLGDSSERFSGALKLFLPDGRHLPHERSRMAIALTEGIPCRNEEVVIERPDGSRVPVLVNVEPVRDERGEVVAAINEFHEIIPIRDDDLIAGHLAAIVDNSDDAIISKNLSSIIQTWNKSAERIFGYTAEEAIGKPVTIIIPSERHHEETEILKRLRQGERVDHFETVRTRKDGTLLDVSLTISPVKDHRGRIVGASKIVRDITERKRMERVVAELQQRYAIGLEEKVKRTSAELTQSQERLRLAERMASLGTLSAGLGHDLGNVLMPLRAHVDALAAQVQGNGSHEHLEAIRKSMEYLHTLASGLRMLTVEPTRHSSGAPQQVRLAEWWTRAEPILRTALGRRFALEHDIPADLPPVLIPAPMLTQAVFNLVQNAAQAMGGSSPKLDGRVRIEAHQSGKEVLLSVADNGPGMSEEVRRRCIEPYFTTKPRGISTGLGLTLVHGILQSVDGSLDVESESGRGATFTLRLRIAEPVNEQECMVALRVADRRLAALAAHLLQSLRVRYCDDPQRGHVMVTDDADQAAQFLSRGSASRAVVFGEAFMPNGFNGRLTLVQPGAKTAEIRAALAAAIAGIAGADDHAERHETADDPLR